MPARPTCSLLGLGSPSWFTRSVLQHLFESQGRENILAASSSKQTAASSSSKQQQQASNSKQQLSSFLPIRISHPHISVIIDGTSPKLSWQIVLTIPYKHTKFQVKSRQGAGLVSERNTNRGKKKPQKKREKNAKKTRKKREKNAKRCAENREKNREKNSPKKKT